MKYVGQFIVYPDKTFDDNIALFLGWTTKKQEQATLAGLVKGKFVVKKVDAEFPKLHFLRVKDKTSPTGQVIYWGAFTKKGVFSHFTIKPPSVTDYKKELKKIKTLNSK